MATTEEPSATAQPDSPTSRFTAVNTKEQPASAPVGINGSEASRRTSEERSNGQPRMPPPGQEKLTITTAPRDDWVPPANGGDRHSYQPPGPYSEADALHKRKRAGSLGPDSSSAHSYHSHQLPPSTKQTPTTASTESDDPRQDNLRAPQQHEYRDAYGPDVQYRQSIPPTEDHRDQGPRNDPWHHGYPQQHHNHTDEQIRAALEGGVQHMDQHRGYLSPDQDDRSPYDGYGNDRREMSAGSDPKKRKRNFSNRTKTGCMTCRRRKKKCDENRPECNNCLRGGFVCSGYQQTRNWPKQDQKPNPIPLQSKIEYENSPYAAAPSPYSLHPGHRREPLPGYRGQNLRVDPQHGRYLDDEAVSASTIPSASVASPETNRLSAVSYTGQMPTPVTASSSAYPDRQLKTPYDRVGPLHDPSRQEQRPDLTIGTPLSAASNIPQIMHPQSHMHIDSPRANPQIAAQLALGLTTNAVKPTVQREEMLAGRYYFPFDKDLVNDRERCNSACWRFNNSTNPLGMVSAEERARFFRNILQPPPDTSISPTNSSPLTPLGRVGDNVVVEAPFNCDYGYNISIGQDVAIGRNCTILDACEVIIGDRCMIGPNVSIYTSELPKDPRKRLGSRGPASAKRIIIESDCWIGGGVTLLPGIKVGKGSTIGAGSVVTRDVPMYVIVAGNPAHVKRGIHHDEH